MADIGLDDLMSEAADTAGDAAEPSQSTGDFLAETVKLLDQRGLLEPMLFGKERLADPNPDPVETAGGVNISAETIAEAGRGVMDQLGSDVTVAELVDICEANPQLVNQQLDKLQTGAVEPELEPEQVPDE